MRYQMNFGNYLNKGYFVFFILPSIGIDAQILGEQGFKFLTVNFCWLLWFFRIVITNLPEAVEI